MENQSEEARIIERESRKQRKEPHIHNHPRRAQNENNSPDFCCAVQYDGQNRFQNDMMRCEKYSYRIGIIFRYLFSIIIARNIL